MVLFNAIEHFPNKNNERIYPVSDDEDIDYSDFSFNYKYNTNHYKKQEKKRA